MKDPHGRPKGRSRSAGQGAASSGGRDRDHGSGARTWAVGAGAVALILAVWASLWLAQSRSEGGGGDEVGPSRIDIPTRLPGFRPQAFYLPDDSLLGFVEIPAGPFTMGSDPGTDSLAFDIEWWGEGRVQASVELPTFYMARHETTVAQYADFLRLSGHPVADPAALSGPPDHPVTSVAWTDAIAYVRWLDDALRNHPGTPEALKRLLGDGWQVGLPSEAQWEKAARSDDARIYPWGDQPSRQRANYRASSTAPVGSFPCLDCAFSLTDMAGNVWEWTRSPYQPYPYDEADDEASVGADALWVMRGGSYQDPERLVRAANRGGADPGARRPFIGFRIALTR